MSDVHYVKHRVFRETKDVIFYDISVEESNASDLVVHTGAAISPPDDIVGAKQFYIHKPVSYTHLTLPTILRV